MTKATQKNQDTPAVIIIGIAGASASGKSLMANTIIEELGTKEVAVISEDSYYKDFSSITFEERKSINYDHPDALDHELLTTHLRALEAGETVHVPVYDFTQHLRTNETKEVGGHRIIVFEGILLFSDQAIRDALNIKIFMDTALDICLSRRLVRDTKQRKRSLDSVLDQYHATVRPMYLQFIEPSKKYADIIVPRGGENRIAIDMVKAKMREMLKK